MSLWELQVWDGPEGEPVAPLANMLFGAMCEAAMMVARSDDPRRATKDVLAELRTITPRQPHDAVGGRALDDGDRVGEHDVQTSQAEDCEDV